MRTNEQKLIRSCYVTSLTYFVYKTYPQHKKNTAWTASSFHAYPSCDCMVFKVGGNLLHGSWQALHRGGLTSGIFKWRTLTMLLMMCHFTSFQLISIYFIFATKLSKHDMHVCVSVWVPWCLVHRQDAHEMSGHLKNARKCQENIIAVLQRFVMNL